MLIDSQEVVRNNMKHCVPLNQFLPEWAVQAAMTNYNRLGGLNNRHLLSHHLEVIFGQSL